MNLEIRQNQASESRIIALLDRPKDLKNRPAVVLLVMMH